MPRVVSKNKNPFSADQVVVATRTFATENTVVHVGEKYRGRDPVVEQNWSAFVDGDTLPSGLPNFWNELPAPPDHRATEDAIRIGASSLANVPPHRLVRATSSFWFDGGYAPGSPGEGSGRPSGFGTAINIGQLLEISHPVVAQHPKHFEFVRRTVTAADVERLAREIER